GVAAAGGMTDLNLVNGSLTLSAGSAGSAWGSSSTITSIATAVGTTAVLNVGANTTLTSNFLMVGGDVHGVGATNNTFNFPNYTSGAGTLNVNTASTASVVTNTLFLGAMCPPSAGVDQVINFGSATVSPVMELKGSSFANWGNADGNNAGGLTGSLYFGGP